jgi:hypothetical protein
MKPIPIPTDAQVKAWTKQLLEEVELDKELEAG